LGRVEGGEGVFAGELEGRGTRFVGRWGMRGRCESWCCGGEGGASWAVCCHVHDGIVVDCGGKEEGSEDVGEAGLQPCEVCALGQGSRLYIFPTSLLHSSHGGQRKLETN
jgi:hypothetical protein